MGVDIKKLVRDYVKDDLDTWGLQQALVGRSGGSGTLDAELAALDTDLSHSREALSERNHLSFMSPHLTPEMLSELVTVTDPRERTMDKAILCYQMLKARIRLVEANIEQLTGHFTGHDAATILKDLDLVESASPSPAPCPCPRASPCARGCSCSC